MDRKVRVAIACQGGGSHTAFTAGALKRLLRDQRHEFVALSGTSGGAICAFLAWHALVHGDEGGAGERAAKLLDSFWTDNAASEPFDWLLNQWTVWINRLQGSIVLPSVSPYSTPTSFWAQEQLRRTLERHVDFGELKTPMESPTPMLLIGAVNVLSGDLKAFNSRRDTISSDTVLASTAATSSRVTSPSTKRSTSSRRSTIWSTSSFPVRTARKRRCAFPAVRAKWVGSTSISRCAGSN